MEAETHFNQSDARRRAQLALLMELAGNDEREIAKIMLKRRVLGASLRGPGSVPRLTAQPVRATEY